MKKILLLKHWQIFIILIIPMVINFVLRGSDYRLGSISSMTIAVILAILYLIIFFSWVLTIGLFIGSLPDAKYRLRKSIFTIAVLISFIGYSKLNLTVILNVDNYLPDWILIIQSL